VDSFVCVAARPSYVRVWGTECENFCEFTLDDDDDDDDDDYI
jgi:hypothetical protein